MFEKTFEAQALDAPSAHLSPFSIALGVHMVAAFGILAISFVMVPVVSVPDPPDRTVFIWTVPLETIPEAPAPVAPKPPKKGSESPGPAVVPPSPARYASGVDSREAPAARGRGERHGGGG